MSTAMTASGSTYYPVGPPYPKYDPTPIINVYPQTGFWWNTALTEAQARELIREELARLFPKEAQAAAKREAPCDKCGR